MSQSDKTPVLGELLEGLPLEAYEVFGRNLSKWFEDRYTVDAPSSKVFADTVEVSLRIFIAMLTSYVELSVEAKDCESVKACIIDLFVKQMDLCLSAEGCAQFGNDVGRLNVH